MKRIFLSILIIVGLFSSCCEEKENKALVQTTDSLQTDSAVRISKTDYRVLATLWFKEAAEVKALYYQNFNYAKSLLDEALKKGRFKLKKKKPKAIITDVDETVLDNSPYNAEAIKDEIEYSFETWSKWVHKKEAKALPGALDFAKYAEEKGVEIFYVSNRSVKNLDYTLANLKQAGFPFADEKHIILKDKSSDKTERRNAILKNYEVVLYLGDNLRDFSEIFKYTEKTNRADSVDAHKDLFGTKFIIFPNSMYGEWEKALYKGDFAKPENEKRKLRADALN